MSTVCRCGKHKILGRGWVTEHGMVYCPDCWAKELDNRRKREARGQQTIADGRAALAALRGRLDGLKGRLLPYVERQARLPVPLADAAASLAEYGVQRLEFPYDLLKRVEQGPLLRLLDEIRGIERVTTNKVEQELQDILGTLESLAGLDTAAAVRLLVEQCMRLHDVSHVYWPKVEFPVPTLAQLNAADPEAIYGLLLQTACDLQASEVARNVAIIALGEIGDLRAVEPLLGLLSRLAQFDVFSCDSTISNVSCALAVLGDERGVLPALEAAHSHFGSGAWPHWQARDFIADRLARVIIPGSTTHQQVQAMRDRLRGSLVFWDEQLVRMIDRILGESHDGD